MHYRLVSVAGKLYQVFASTYSYAIAQAVGQAVADGVEVKKSTPVDLVLVGDVNDEEMQEILKFYGRQ